MLIAQLSYYHVQLPPEYENFVSSLEEMVTPVERLTLNKPRESGLEVCTAPGTSSKMQCPDGGHATGGILRRPRLSAYHPITATYE